MDAANVTLLLRRMDDGDTTAAEVLYREVYGELRRRAAGLLGAEGASHTLGATGVVNEAWLRVERAGSGDEGWSGRKHFLGVAAKAMRSVLVDHARARAAEKRGGGRERLSIDLPPEERSAALDGALASFESRALDLLALDEALEDLGRFDPQLAKLVELRFFAGLSIAETSEVLGCSTATVERGWRTARAVLRAGLESEDGQDDACA